MTVPCKARDVVLTLIRCIDVNNVGTMLERRRIYWVCIGFLVRVYCNFTETAAKSIIERWEDLILDYSGSE